MPPGQPGPLEGFTVVEISTRPSGLYCGSLLAALGAEVVRVSLDVALDTEISLAPEVLRSLDRDKRVVTLKESVLLAPAAHLVVVDTPEHDALASSELLDAVRDKPMIDIAAYRDRLGKAPAVAATSIQVTARSAMSWALGEPAEPPLTLPYDLPEYLAGTEAAAAAALSLYGVASGTPGARRWDISATDVMSYYVGQISRNFLPYERPWARDGARATMSGGSYPAAMFPCIDGWVSIMCRTNREWSNLLAALGRPEWARHDDYRDARIVARLHADEADKHLTAWTGGHTREEIFALGREFGFPVSPVLSVAESIAQPQVAYRGFLTELGTDDQPLVAPSRPWKIVQSPSDRSGSDPSPERIPARPSGAPRPFAPLTGIRVLDLSWVWSGPMTSAALQDLGAEVVKVEFRGRADPARLRGPAIRDGVPVEGPDLEVTPYFNQLNHGKKSVAINMGTPEGVELILDLARQSDIVIENMRPGALTRRGLDYAALSAVNPSLIMVSMSMTGQDGPLSSIGGYAPVMSGLAGLDSLVGYSPERLIGTFNPALGDPTGAAHALTTALAMLASRARTGRGGWVDLSQVECLMSTMRGPIIEAQRRGSVTVPGNRHQIFGPHGTYACAGNDTWVSVAARNSTECESLASVIGADPSADLEPQLAAWLSKSTADVAEGILVAAGVPAAAVSDISTMVGSNWHLARQNTSTVLHPYLGETEIFTLPWKPDGTALRADLCAPTLGQHTDEVLIHLLGLDESQLADFRQLGAIE